MQINISIEASSSDEYRHALETLCKGLESENIKERVKGPVGEPEVVATNEATEPETFKRNSYFRNSLGNYLAFEKGSIIPDFINGCSQITKKAYEAGIKKQKEEQTAEASTDSTLDTETLKAGEQPEPTEAEMKPDKIEPEVATETRYFFLKSHNKTFVVEKGNGLPVEAIHFGDAKELTKEEYDEIVGNKASESEAAEEEQTFTFEDITQILKEAQKVQKLSKAKDILLSFNVDKISALKESDYPAFMYKMQKLLKR